jgi:hypothetical protein
MKTYYSIVSIATKPQMNEQFNIGLLCITPEKTFFHFSEVKLKILSKLLSANGSKLALSALKGMNQQLNENPKVKNDLFPINHSLPVSVEYLNYLNRYNNNLVQFSEVTPIDLVITNELFETLFRKYIFSEEVFEMIEKQPIAFFSSVRKHFKQKAKNYANINFSVGANIIPEMIVPVTVDVFGKNGSFVAGQSIDFTKSFESLKSDVSSYLYLVEHTERKDKGSKCFLLGEEPSVSEKAHHGLWKDIRMSGIIEFVPLNESEKIIEYMKEKGVIPVE